MNSINGYKEIILIFSYLFISFPNFCQQNKSGTYLGQVMLITSIQGTWDKTKDTTRAQFVGNNKLINAYFGNFSNEFKKNAYNINSTAELFFKIDTIGNVDSVFFINSFGQDRLDYLVKSIIESTSGKWRVGKVNNRKQQEYMRIWIHVYADYKDKLTLDGFIEKAENHMQIQEFERAIKNLDRALNYDELNITASKLKGECLIKLNRRQDACELWNRFKKYETIEINSLIKNHCE